MYLQEIVEVAIGLIFVWLVISIATMQIQEWFANILGKRSNDLEITIREMLADPKKFKEFYNHPLIKSLSKPISDTKKRAIALLEDQPSLNHRGEFMLWLLKSKPSYIPSKNFAMVLFDIISKAGTSRSPIHATMTDLKAEIEALGSGDRKSAQALLDRINLLGEALGNLPDTDNLHEEIKEAILDQIDFLGNNHPRLGSLTQKLKIVINNPQFDTVTLFKSNQVLEQVRAGSKELLSNNSDLGKSLNSLLAGIDEYATGADNALAIGRKNVEEWFDGTMERMSGWYKRWSQKIAFVIGLILAITLNIDSVALAKHLWKEPAVRQALAANADEFLTENDTLATPEGISPSDAIAEFQSRFDGLTLPIGWELYLWKADEDEENKVVCNALEQTVIVNKKINITTINPPANGAFLGRCIVITNLPSQGEGWLKGFGMLLTALAAMQGAPFWFDLLKKIVNVRSSGANPAEKPQESTSDKRE